MDRLAAVVLCAGKGKRMKSSRAKVLHEVLGRPLCSFPISRALEVGAEKVVAVVGHQAEDVEAALRARFAGDAMGFAVQGEQRGTAHAVGCAKEALLGFEGAVLILYGDTPLLQKETLARPIAAFRARPVPLALVTTVVDDPSGYGRVVREGGEVRRVVEHRDCTEEERALREVNAGVYLVDARFLFAALERIEPTNAQGELYLTDVVEQAAARGGVASVRIDFDETAGVNDRADLARCARALQARINARHMREGVTLLDPASAYLDEGVEIGQDTVIGPMVTVGEGCWIGAGVRIGQGCVLHHSRIADGCELKPYSVLDEAEVGPACVLGPFVRVRPGTALERGVHLGNFVETKKARIGEGSKAGHLSYLGDAVVGAGVNIGAGTITCNYDGVDKHQTVIGDGVFIGSDTQLVAPVTVGQGAFVGAGTTLTQDVPALSLALARAPQVIKEGWVTEKKKRKGKGR